MIVYIDTTQDGGHASVQNRSLPIPLLPLANRREGRVRLGVETSAVGDPHFNVVQPSVARHDGSRAVLEADLRWVFEDVVDELGAVRRPEFDALRTADDGIPCDDVVLTPPGIHNPRVIRPLVRVNVVPEDGTRLRVTDNRD